MLLQIGTGWGSQSPSTISMSLWDLRLVVSQQCERLQVMMDFLKEWEEKLHVKITCSQVHLCSRLQPSVSYAKDL